MTAIGISLPVVLKSGGEVTDFLAYLDTGASNCLFERRRAELLKLEIEAGDRRIFRTVIGGVVAFGHVVEIEVLGVAFESMVYFFADEWINKNLLGRIGWCTKGTLLRHSNPRIPVEPPQSVKYPLEKWRNCPRITG